MLRIVDCGRSVKRYSLMIADMVEFEARGESPDMDTTAVFVNFNFVRE